MAGLSAEQNKQLMADLGLQGDSIVDAMKNAGMDSSFGKRQELYGLFNPQNTGEPSSNPSGTLLAGTPNPNFKLPDGATPQGVYGGTQNFTGTTEIPSGGVQNSIQYPRSGDMRGNTNNFVQPNLAQNNAITDAVGVGDTAKNLSNNSGFMSSAKGGLGFLQNNQDSIGAGIKMAGSAIEYGKTTKALDEAMDTIDDSIKDLNKSIGTIGGKASQYTESVKDDASESQQFDAVNQFASIEKKDVGKKGQFRQKMVDVQNNINKKLTTLASVRQEKSNKAIEGIMAEATGVTESLNSNIGELNDEKDLMEDAKKNAKKNMLIDMAVGGATIGAGIIGGPGAAKAVSTIGGTAGDYFKSSNKYNV